MSAPYVIRPDGVAVVTVTNPPVNSLSQSVLKALSVTFKALSSDPSVKGIVLTGANNTFCGGAEIAEFEMALKMLGGKASPQIAQVIHDVVSLIEATPKTVVAAIRGVALGGGCELALACHYRVCDSKAQIGLPEINLGLVPGGQGTQRILRLCPIEFSLQLLLGGSPVSADAAKKAGLIDEVVLDHLIDSAAQKALTFPIRKTSQLPLRKIEKVKVAAGGVDGALVQAAKLRKGNPGVVGIGECVKAGFDLSFEQGCRVEREVFAKCVSSKESAALRYLFFSERAAAKLDPNFAGGVGESLQLRKIGVVGAGLMGGGIAMCFLNKGVPVILLDAKQEWLDKGLDGIRKNYATSVASKKLTETDMKKRLALLTGTLSYSDFSDCDMVIEAVFEDFKLKAQIFSQLDIHCKPSAVLCTNTSSLDIDALAKTTSRPERVMGTHFFSPANVMKLLENVKGKAASPSTLATCQAMGRLIGKVAVLVGNCDGFVGNRMLGPYAAEARILLEEGASVEQVDKAMTDFGFPMGPLTLADMVGLELFWRMRKAAGNMDLETKVSIGPYEIGDWLCEKGRFGQKTGRGFYIYGKERSDKRVDPELVLAIESIAQSKGIKRRQPASYNQTEIEQRLLFPMVNEGFKILQEGMAQRASDIDIIYIYGFGFPPVRGGPMHWAEKQIGLGNVLEAIRKMKSDRESKAIKGWKVRDYLQVSPLLELCVKEGLGINEGLKRWINAKQSKL